MKVGLFSSKWFDSDAEMDIEEFTFSISLSTLTVTFLLLFVLKPIGGKLSHTHTHTLFKFNLTGFLKCTVIVPLSK